MICALAPELRPAAFLRLWTCKESYVKACSEGLYLALDSFEVNIDAPGGARLVHAHDGDHGSERRALRELAAPAGYLAALTVEGTGDIPVCGDTRALSSSSRFG